MFSKLVLLVERLGGVVLAVIATLTFVSVLMRYLVNVPIPDSFDFSRQMMAIVILWGIAGACYYGDHIQFEAVWTAVGPRAKRVIDVIASLVTLISISFLTVMLALRVVASRETHVTTSGLGIDLWPFHLAAWVGSALAVLLMAVRVFRLIFNPKQVESAPIGDGV